MTSLSSDLWEEMLGGGVEVESKWVGGAALQYALGIS